MQLQVRTKHKAFALLCCLNASLYLGCNEPVEESEQDAQVQQTDQDGGKLGEINDQIKLASNDPTLYYNKALIHFEKGDLDASFGDINRALSLDSTNNTYLSFMSDVLYFQGDVEAARSFITHWLTIYPGNKEALIKVAKLHILLQDYDSSLTALETMQDRDQFNPQIYFYQCVTYKAMGDTVNAIKAFQKTVALNQENVQGHIQLGRLFSAKNDKVAIQYFNRALEADSVNIEAFYGKAMFYQNRTKPEMAEKLYKKILAIEPNHLDATYNMGFLSLIYFDKLTDGVKYFTSAIELNPNYIEAIYNRGYCYELLEDANNARVDYKKTLSLNPQYDLGAEGLSRVGR